MPDPTDIVKRLRDYASCTDSDVDDAATAIETLLAQRAVLAKIAKKRTVDEWEAFAKDEGLDPDGADYTGAYDAIVREARAATDAAFTEGLKK